MSDDAAARRAEWCQDHAAQMAAYWGLAGIEPGIVAAVKYAAVFGTGVHRLPRVAADMIAAGIDSGDRDVVAAALQTIAKRAGPGHEGAEDAVNRLCGKALSSLSDGARERLKQRLVGGDIDFPLRCRRAAAMAALGQHRGDQEMVSAAVELAIRECREKRALTPSVIFAVAGPIWHPLRDNPGAMDAALVTEIHSATAAMAYPDAVIGGV